MFYKFPTFLSRETGTLMNLSNSTWHGNDNGGRLEIYMNKPKPIGLHNHPIVNNIPDSFIKFTPSDKDADASQTIVPYLVRRLNFLPFLTVKKF